MINRVTQQLEAASFLKHMEAHAEEYPQDETGALHARIDERRGRTRLECAAACFEDNETFPDMSRLYLEHTATTRERISRVTDALRDTDTVSLPSWLTLRRSQTRFLSKLRDYFSGDVFRRSGFVKYPPGIGKTVLIALMIRSLIERINGTSLVLSQRRKINDQNYHEILSLQDEGASVKMAASVCPEETPDVTIAAYTKLILDKAANLSRRILKDHYDVIFLDECHRSFGFEAIRVLREYYPDSVLVGLSATPYIGASFSSQTQMRSAFHYIEGEIDNLPLPEACASGEIAPLRTMTVMLKGTDDDSEDSPEEDADECEPPFLSVDTKTRIATAICKDYIPAGEQGIIFLRNRLEASLVADALKAAGLKAEFICGGAGTAFSQTTYMRRKEVEDRLRRFQAGDTQYITNVESLIEGANFENLKHVINLSDTRSVWEFEQMIGRATRLDPKDPEKIATIWDTVVEGRKGGRCTLIGLAAFYGQHKEEYLNGEVIFGPPERKQVCMPSFAPFSLFGIDAELSEIILAEQIDRIATPMDHEYFKKIDENVKPDLAAFARAAGVGGARSLTGSHLSWSATCMNGETITFETYVARWAAAMQMAKDTTSARENICDFVYKLLHFAGCTVKKMDAQYYEDTEGNVKPDMRRFAGEAGLESPAELTTTHFSEKITCESGKYLSLQAYVIKCALKTKRAKTHEEAKGNQGRLLRELLQRCGYAVKEKAEVKIEMDAAYFKNIQGNVIPDMQGFANAAGVKSPADLTTTDIQKKSRCQNGEIPNLETYICRWAVSLGHAKNNDDVHSKISKMLDQLLRYCGYAIAEKIEFEEMDEAYFKNMKGTVEPDVAGFVAAAGVSSAADLAGVQHRSVRSRCKNGESPMWQTYVARWAKALKHVKNAKDALKEFDKISCKFLRYCGYEVEEKEEFLKMDKEYFMKVRQNLMPDVAGFLAAAGVMSVADLRGRRHFDVESRCSNGEIISLKRFICRWSVATGRVKIQKDAERWCTRLLREFVEWYQSLDLSIPPAANVLSDVVCKELEPVVRKSAERYRKFVDVGDIVNEVFLRILEVLQQDPSARFEADALEELVGEAAAHLRRDSGDHGDVEYIDTFAPHNRFDGDSKETAGHVSLISDVVERLSEPARTIISMQLAGHSEQEIATALKIKKPKVASLIKNAHEDFRRLYQIKEDS
ncbi:MAG: DEAD/DEAH box helicase family protein [Patescibacteria group bacterium]